MTRFETKTVRRIDALAQLMLLVSRPILSAEQVGIARTLVGQITDWSEYLAFASRNASLPFLYHHARIHALLDELPEVAAVVRIAAMRSVAAAGRMRAALRRYHISCIAPSNASHVYVKGPVLAARYYPEPNLRICTDIDVLVCKTDFAETARASLSAGYRFSIGHHPLTFAVTRQDIDFIIRHAEVISAFDQELIHIEIHRQLEKTTPIFPDAKLLATSETIRVDGLELSTLSTAWHFCYIVYHHSRHFWSRLHWVADLHAIMADPSFNRAEVLTLASQIGLHPSVAAALSFAELTSQPERWNSELEQTPGGIFLDACLRGLPGDHAFELESWDVMFLFDFGDEWQFDRKKKLAFWRKSALRRLRPELTQYIKNRRPRSLEWLYTLENIGALSQNALRRLGLE